MPEILNEVCCTVGCPNLAEFSIISVRDVLPHGQDFAGPDMHSDYTFGCSAHVGGLLGWQDDAVDTEQIYWKVRPYQAGELLDLVA